MFLAHIPEPQIRVPNSAHLLLIAGISSFSFALSPPPLPSSSTSIARLKFDDGRTTGRTPKSSICQISVVCFIEKIKAFSKTSRSFQKSTLPTSLVARVLVNHFVAPSVLFRKGSCSRLSLYLAPWLCRVRYGTKNASGTIIFFARVTTTAVCSSRPPGSTTRKYTPLSKMGYAAGAPSQEGLGFGSCHFSET